MNEDMVRVFDPSYPAPPPPPKPGEYRSVPLDQFRSAWEAALCLALAVEAVDNTSEQRKAEGGDPAHDLSDRTATGTGGSSVE
jgi:hypothetical protein